MDNDLHNQTVASEIMDLIADAILKGLTYEELAKDQLRESDAIMEQSVTLKKRIQAFQKSLKQ